MTLRVLEKIASFLSEKTGKFALKGFLLSAKQKAQDAEKLTGLRKELKSVYERFTVRRITTIFLRPYHSLIL
jgi:ABC-type Na+ transport system ATPase subunit NatA